MARQKRPSDRGRVVRDAVEHEAAVHADVQRAIGQDRPILPTPTSQVPISTILIELCEPHRLRLEDPDDPDALSALVNIATMVWNTSRVIRGPDAATAALSRTAWEQYLAGDPEGARLAGAMMDLANRKYPRDPRLVVRADVVVRRGEFSVRATSTDGVPAAAPGPARRGSR